MQLSRTCRRVASLAVVLAWAGRASAQRPEEHAPPHLPPDPPAASAEPPALATHPVDVRGSSEVAAYADTDHVYVISPTVAAAVTHPTAGWSVDGRYLVDVVSAASVDIVSTASRPFHEVRHAGALNGTYKPGDLGASANGAVSSEPDYLSLSAGGTVSQDLFDRNVTLLAGYGHARDVAGRTGTSFSLFSRTLDTDAIKLGGTLIVDRATVFSILGDAIFESGDPSKPYRYVPLFAPGTVVPRGASPDLVNRLRTSARVLEQLPLSRERYALDTRMAHRFDRATLRLDERMYADTWGMKATTTDARVLLDLAPRVELGPHLRFHAQSPVSFWQRAYELRAGFDVPAIRTGDRELGPLVNLTGGASLKWAVGPRATPDAVVLGLEGSVTDTQYLDALYLRTRLSTLGVLSIEVRR